MSKSHELSQNNNKLDPRKLHLWYQRQKRVLPWRSKPTLYLVWISEIMLQQTQVKTMLPFFKRFLQDFPNVQKLANASEADVVKRWAGLGYYTRARSLHRAAQLISRSGFPKKREDWLKIPGVGPYTAGAILSIALNQPEAILDGNIERVLCRIHRIPKDKNILWSLSSELVQKASRLGVEPRDFNQAMMELGALVCLPKNPNCMNCPFKARCRAFKEGVVLDYPPASAPKVWVEIKESRLAILNSKKQVLMQRQKKGQWRAGLWDLPEFAPEYLKIKKTRLSAKTQHVVTRHRIQRKTILCHLQKGGERKTKGEPKDFRWVGFKDLLSQRPSLALGSAAKKTLQKLNRLGSDRAASII